MVPSPSPAPSHLSVTLATASLDPRGGEGAGGQSAWSRKTPSLSAGGPAVRIRLAPAASLSHECLPCLQAQRPGFDSGFRGLITGGEERGERHCLARQPRLHQSPPRAPGGYDRENNETVHQREPAAARDLQRVCPLCSSSCFRRSTAICRLSCFARRLGMIGSRSTRCSTSSRRSTTSSSGDHLRV